MSSLMALVTIVTAQVVQIAVVTDGYFIDRKESQPLAFESGEGRGFCGIACFCKPVLSQLLLLFLLFFGWGFEVDDHSTACQQIIELAQSN